MREKLRVWGPLLWLAMVPLSAMAAPPTAPKVEAGPRTDAAAEALIQKFEEIPKGSPAAQFDRFIAENKAIVTVTARPYGSALMWMLEHERKDAALALLRAGSPLPDGAVTLAARGGMDEIIPLLIARGAREVDRDHAMHAAARYGHVSTLRLLLSLGASTNEPGPNDGFTPLHMAVIERRLEAIKVLLEAGADLEARDRNGKTPLAWGPFAYGKQEKHVYESLGKPHDTVFVDPGEAEGIKLLLDAGANIHATDSAGDTPLHEAVRLGSLRGVEALIARGAKPNLKNRAGETPLSLAKSRKDLEIIKLLSSAKGKK